MRRWVLVAAVVVQVTVPLVALFRPPPAMFGFQMYSGRGGTSVVVRDARGHRLPLRPHQFVANFRGEVDWTDRLPAYLCHRVPEAASVDVASHGHERRLTCAP